MMMFFFSSLPLISILILPFLSSFFDLATCRDLLDPGLEGHVAYATAKATTSVAASAVSATSEAAVGALKYEVSMRYPKMDDS